MLIHINTYCVILHVQNKWTIFLCVCKGRNLFLYLRIWDLRIQSSQQSDLISNCQTFLFDVWLRGAVKDIIQTLPCEYTHFYLRPRTFFGSVYWSICGQDYGKTTGPIYMTLGVRVQHGPRKNSFNFGADTNHGSLTILKTAMQGWLLFTSSSTSLFFPI